MQTLSVRSKHGPASLRQSVEELRALGEVSQAVNSSLQLERVLSTIVSRAVQISGTDAGAIYVFDQTAQLMKHAATFGTSQEMIDAISAQHLSLNEMHLASATQQRQPVQVRDLRDEPVTPVNKIVLEAGYRALLIVPLLRGDIIVGALVVRRREPGAFPEFDGPAPRDLRLPIGSGDPERATVP